VASITPPVPCLLAGFGARSQPAAAVRDRLEARALYVAGDRSVCLVVCDLLGMTPEFSDPVRTAVGESVGCPPEAVLVACTHTHSGPNTMGAGEALGWTTPDGYLEAVVGGCRDAAVTALDQARAATLRFARGPLPEGLSVNRRGLPHEPTFAALDIVDLDGTRLGVVANMAIHPVMLGPEVLEVSTDWVGPFREALEDGVGGTAILLSAALGDVNPPDATSPPGGEERFAETAALGRGLAAACRVLLERAGPVAGEAIGVSRREIRVPVAATVLAALMGSPDSATIELVEWSIGSLEVLAIPGEGFSAFGLRVLDARGPQVLLAGLAPAWCGYLPVPFGEGYEEGISLGDAAVRQILEAITAPGDPSPA
jgi:hypothetical protein